jgi:hypothetical protein
MKMAIDRFRAEIEALAYRFWEERGHPLGSPEEDWFRAERHLRHPVTLPFSSIAMGPDTRAE